MKTAEPEIIARIRRKDIDDEIIAERLINNPGQIQLLIDVIKSEKGSIKFGCEKVLRLISAERPELLYKYFDFFEQMMNSENTFLRAGAILTIANLTAVDADNKFDKIFKKYFSFISAASLISAANVICSSPKIIESKPDLLKNIVRELLKVERAKYLSKGVISPECTNVAIGHAIHAFDQFYHRISNTKAVDNFVTKQLKNSRKPVVKSAEIFILKHKIAS